MDFATILFLTGMMAAVAYVSYIILCDVYALLFKIIEDFSSHSLLLKLHTDN